MIDYNFFNFLLVFAMPFCIVCVITGFLFEIGRDLYKKLKPAKDETHNKFRYYVISCKDYDEYEEKLKEISYEGSNKK